MSGERTERSGLWTLGIGLTAAVGVLALVMVMGGGRLSLPALFAAIAGLCLAAALFTLWESLRAVFGAKEPLSLDGTGPDTSGLEDEKRSLLRSIKDLTFEREVGKVSDEDFERLDAAYRARAREVLRALDEDLAPFMEEAERLVDEAVSERPTKKRSKKRKARTSKAPRPVAAAEAATSSARQRCPECGADNDADADWCKSCAARLSPQTCASCGTENERDASFCKRCAAPLGREGAKAREVPPAAEAEVGEEEADEETKASAEAEEAHAEEAADEGAADAAAEKRDGGEA